MSFRTVIVTDKAKLNYKNNYMVVKKEEGEKYIHMSEIDTVIVDSIAVSISSYLLKELSNNKINIIFCDEKHNPFGEFTSYYSSHNTSKKIITQTKWKDEDKDKLWKKIVENKITNQALLLHYLEKDKYEMLISYVHEVVDGDKTNREGHAAKVYFNELFGKLFSRSDSNDINAALNYGYGILLSTINKEISSLGYITQLGLHHKNEFNPFNLACDLMESFRPIIDKFVYYNQSRTFDSKYKYDIINILNNKFTYDGKNYILKDVIKMFVKNTLESIDDVNKYKGFYIYEE